MPVAVHFSCKINRLSPSRQVRIGTAILRLHTDCSIHQHRQHWLARHGRNNLNPGWIERNEKRSYNTQPQQDGQQPSSTCGNRPLPTKNVPCDRNHGSNQNGPPQAQRYFWINSPHDSPTFDSNVRPRFRQSVQVGRPQSANSIDRPSLVHWFQPMRSQLRDHRSNAG